MTVTQLIPPATAPQGRQGYAATLPQVASLTELAPYLTRRLSRSRRAGEQMAMLWIELEPLPSARAETTAEQHESLLRTASLRVRNRLRSTDEVVQVGKAGFAVLLPAAGAPEAALVGQRLRRTLTGAYELDGRLAYVAVAMGEATYPDCGPSGTDLAQAAKRSLVLRQGG
ncbi:MAG: diguanylate cyclase [Burkholderiales bacterium]|nr:MAG: diguanylate cyclase [Burkholderiales bacterium]